MEIIQRPVESLVPYANNARKHSDEQVDKIAASIREFGFNSPILVNPEGTIIAGHARLAAARKAGLKEVPTLCLSHLSKTAQKAYILADNRIALDSSWDMDLLKVEFETLQDEGFDMSLTGFTPDELAFPSLDAGNDGNTDPDSVPDVGEPVTVTGDLWVLGNHRLHCGDSTMIDQVDRLMNGETPILMLTDPPYGVKLDQTWRDGLVNNDNGNKNLVKNDDRADWQDAYSLFNGTICYVWHASKYSDVVKHNLESCGFEIRQQIIWNKTVMVFSRSAYHWKHEPCWYAVKKGADANWKGDRTQTTVWDVDAPSARAGNSKEDRTEHPTQKPVLLFERPILNHTSTKDGVYDPFGGSGTTIIACEKNGRKGFLMELDPKYCDIIVKRWQKFSGKDAVLESNGMTFSEVENGKGGQEAARDN